MPMPLDALLLQTEPGQDEFTNEKYAAQIAAILNAWSTSLLRSPENLQSIEKVLDANFTAAPLTPTQSRAIRQGPPIEIRENQFEQSLSKSREEFLTELGNSLGAFSRILTAEFQVTGIGSPESQRMGTEGGAPSPVPPQPPSQLHTRIRYEVVATAPNIHREQRVGYADLIWKSTAAGSFHLLSWQTKQETQSRSRTRVYTDITASALGSNASYAAQLEHGTDYWRTVLDAACGIDLYGHNGVSVGDIDNDGFDDLYICQPGGLPNRLYRNRGDGTFEDITQASGVGVIENTACALFVDVNNDGRQDLIVVRANGPLLFLNDGNGKFHQQPNAFQFAVPPQGTFTGAAVADYDRDGWLDIYFCLYVFYQGTSQYKYPSPYHDANNGPPNFLMRNNRNGTFRDVTAESGLNQNNTRYSFCCAWNDFNNDGWPDLYVVNDFGRKNLYRNNGNGTFTDVAPEAGVEDIGAGMSAAWFNDAKAGDYTSDNHGLVNKGVLDSDLYVANMWTAAGERITMQEQFKKNSTAKVRAEYHKHAMGNSLFLNSSVSSATSVVQGVNPHSPIPSAQGAIPKFSDVTDISQTRIGRWAWSSDAFDFDHDSHPDLYITNGMVSGPDPTAEDLNSFFWRQVVAKSPDEARPNHDYEQGWAAVNELIRSDRTWSGYERNIFYVNNGDNTFSDISGVAGLDFVEDGRAFAVCDFDQDGRQEIFLKNRNAPQLRILKNVLPSLPPSISFRLQGTKSNRDAIGAVVEVRTEKGSQVRSLQAGYGFLSQHTKDVFFGLGESVVEAQPGAVPTVSAIICWPSGVVQEFHGLPINHRIWIEEAAKEPKRAEPFRTQSRAANTGEDNASNVTPHPPETLPEIVETWLLAPVSAPELSLPVASNLPITDGSHPERNGVSVASPMKSKDPYSFPNSRGEIVALSALRGNPVLVVFGAAGNSTSRQNWLALSNRAASWSQRSLHLLAVNLDTEESLRAFLRGHQLSFPILQGTDDDAAVYNIVFRYIFDRHRDLSLPASFLIDAKGEIVKIYQGATDPAHVEQDFRNLPKTPAERLFRALPFQGVTEVVEFGRNYLSFGSAFFQRGYFNEAADAFEIALRDDPDSAEAVYGIGSVSLNQGKNSEAQKYFERALTMRASYPDTLANSWNNLGLIAGREGRVDDAIAYLQEALRLSPDHRISLNNLGGAYRQKKNWEQAKKTYERALTLNPNDPDSNYGLGMVYAQLDDTARAFELLERALQAKPDYPEALNNLGILYLRTHRRDEAVASFEKAIEVSPDFDQPYLNLARVHLIEGDKEAARALLERLLARHPNHPAARQMLSEAAPE